MNLTRITDPVEAAVKHYADSVALLLWTGERHITARRILDIGTGAGYPSVPLAVVRPDWLVTAIDATAKKIRFLTRVAADLRLPNLRLEQAHAEHWHEGGRFEVVVLRAVGRLGKCLEQAAPHIASNGRLVVYKTASLDCEELRTAQARATQLRLRPEEPFPYELELKGRILRRLLYVYRRPR